MGKNKLRFRQIHMDFHTSGDIIPIGECFDAKDFTQTLKDAHVNSITCFARCHHGYLYYNSKNNPELIHPGLKQKNLLEQQIEACHAIDINVPIYTTVQWDHYTALHHPEWICLNADGSMMGYNIYEPGFYHTLCVNTPYRDFLKKHITDIFESVKIVDGLFLDIVNVIDCSCRHCINDMLEQGYEPTISEQRIKFSQKMLTEFKKEISEHIRSFNKDALIYYNGSNISPYILESKDDYSHWEIESLPSGNWGYSHFPNSVRYAITTGHDILSHTGKFHTGWGDFHSFKNLAALQYECFRMLAYNVKCLVGDQLDPDGAISKPVYDLIGKVYSEVEKKEPWCKNTDSIADIAIITTAEGSNGIDITERTPKYINGLCTMLDELGHQFHIITKDYDFSKYKLLILPDNIFADDNFSKKISEYIKNGGKILATHYSGLDKDKKCFKIKELGVEFKGDAPYSYDFLMPNDNLGKALPKTEHVMYTLGTLVELTNDGETIVDTYTPYFNRTWKHFCSHRHTPSSHKKGYPGVVKTKNTIYFIHPIFTLYNEWHPAWCKQFIKDAIYMLLPNASLKHNGPSTIVTTLNEQKEKNRYILHVLHYIIENKCENILTIEDVIPLYNVEYSIHVDKKVNAISIVPDNKPIEFKMLDNRIVFTIDKIDGHCMVELAY